MCAQVHSLFARVPVPKFESFSITQCSTQEAKEVPSKRTLKKRG